MPLSPITTSYPQTRREPGKHSHPELLTLGIAEDLSHCSTDCLQIFIYTPYIYIYVRETCTRTNHKQGKSQRRDPFPGTCVKSGIPEEPQSVELQRRNYSKKLNLRLQFAM